jgi:hypothetical protein
VDGGAGDPQPAVDHTISRAGISGLDRSAEASRSIQEHKLPEREAFRVFSTTVEREASAERR